jgi:hypothetical protein
VLTLPETRPELCQWPARHRDREQLFHRLLAEQIDQQIRDSPRDSPRALSLAEHISDSPRSLSLRGSESGVAKKERENVLGASKTNKRERERERSKEEREILLSLMTLAVSSMGKELPCCNSGMEKPVESKSRSMSKLLQGDVMRDE